MEVLAKDKRQAKEIKRTYIWKEEVKPSLYADDMILSVREPDSMSTNRLQELWEFGNVAEYKLYKQKSIAFAYRRSSMAEKKPCKINTTYNSCKKTDLRLK